VARDAFVRMRRTLLVIAAVALLVAGSGAGAMADTEKPARTSTLRMNALRARYPVSWTEFQHGGVGVISGFVSNQPMHDVCSTTAAGTLCQGWPIDALEPGGVFVVWENGGNAFRSPEQLAASLSSTPGRVITVDGQPGRVATDPPSSQHCSGMPGAERTIVATVLVERRAQYSMFACLRGPHVSRHTADVMAMLRSARFVT